MSDKKQVPSFNNYPYYDDFDITKNFYRVLFRPGYSVQTREINQLQTILQQQISHISDYSVNDKTAVVGGQINFNKNVNFIKLKAGTNLSRTPSEYNNNIKFSTASGIEGDIFFVLGEDATGPTTLYVNYTSAALTTGKHIPDAGSYITLNFPDGNSETVQVENSTSYYGLGTIVALEDSVFYIKKTFVRVPKQIIVLEKYNQGDIPSYNIGILVNEEIITAADDFTLYDNAYGSPNEAATGADRYKISGILVDKRDLTEAQLENFIELITLEKGVVAEKPKEENPVIPMLQQILARRTYDESGDYIVDTFDLDVREHLLQENLLTKSDNNGVYKLTEGGKEELLVAQLDPGVAYIRGYEVRITETTKLPFEKARETAVVNNNVTQLNYNNYMIITPLTGDLTMGSRLNYLNASNAIIGSGFVVGIQPINDTQIKVFLINSVCNGSYDLIKKCNAAAGVSSLVAFSSTLNQHRISTTYSPLIYLLPYGYSKTVAPTSIQFYKTFNTISTDGVITLANEDNTEVFSLSSNDYYVYVIGEKSGSPLTVTGQTPSSVKLTVTNLSNAPHTGQKTVKVIAKVFSTNPLLKTKTLMGDDGTYKNSRSVASGGVNGRFVLDKADGYELIKVLDENGINVTSKFKFDTGARDTHYEKAAIVLKAGQKLNPNSTLLIHYSYFNHSSLGDYFAVNSYTGLPYHRVPSYTDSTGSSIFLGSAFDFRKIITGDNLDQSSRGHVAITDRVIANITYYLPRKDRIMVTSSQKLVIVKGTPDFNPVLPEELNDAITLYNLTILPYTFSVNDVISEKLNHKRYTMKDIGKLEKRISTVEEIALLNKLESDTASINFQDRFKSGYIVDNFSSSDTGDIYSPHFGVAYDLVDPSIKSKVISEFIDLEFKPAESSGVKLHENTGIVTLDYTPVEMIRQDLASDIVKLQPYVAYGWGTGTMTLSPSVDIWKEEFQHTNNLYTSTTNRLDDIIIKTTQNEPVKNATAATNGWQNDWWWF